MGLLERLEDKFLVMPDGCWEWISTKTQGGYGTIKIERGKTQMAHRVVYELFNGPVAPGLDLDHLCRNRGCVRPHHLDPVTRSENLHRSPLVGRYESNGRRHFDRGA